MITADFHTMVYCETSALLQPYRRESGINLLTQLLARNKHNVKKHIHQNVTPFSVKCNYSRAFLNTALVVLLPNSPYCKEAVGDEGKQCLTPCTEKVTPEIFIHIRIYDDF